MNTQSNVFSPAKLGPLRRRDDDGRLLRGVPRWPHRGPPRPGWPSYLLRDAAMFHAELTMPLILLGGITNRKTMDTAMAQGFDFVAMGRALPAEPDLINRIQADGSVKSMCTHCNRCVPTIYSHTHCASSGAPDR